MNYDLIALDLDGTLVDRGERISAASRDALADAAAAGLKVVPCTGRAWRESADVLRGLPGLDVGVFSSGSMVADFRSAAVLNTAAFDPQLALGIVEILAPLPHAVLVYQDTEQTGRDFLITGTGEVSANTRGWFERNRLTTAHIPQVTAADLAHSLRIGVVAHGNAALDAEAAVRERFADRINAHCIAGLPVAGTEHHGPVYLLEIFSAGVNKWRGLRWLAEHRGIDPARVAAVGDEVNDLAMLKGAALGVAMGQASAAVKAAADRETRSCADDGVAHAIARVLAGDW